MNDKQYKLLRCLSRRRRKEEEFSRVVDITVVGDFLRVSV
jgi:hypothetical protein